MGGQIKEFMEDQRAWMRKAKELSPEAVRPFGEMFSSLMKEGALSVRVKELIALGIAVETRCLPCIYPHVQKCLDAGATPKEIIEAASVAVMMRGGPAYVYLPAVAKAIAEFSPAPTGEKKVEKTAKA